MAKNRPCLRDELKKHMGKTVLLGMSSSFFYVGPAEECIHDLPMLGVMVKCSSSMSPGKGLPKATFTAALAASKGKDIGDRRVMKTYKRGLNDEVVMILEGCESGSFWTRNEYLAGRQMLMSRLKGEVRTT